MKCPVEDAVKLTVSTAANTIYKLFSAQRQHPHAEPVPSSESQAATNALAPAQRSTLHAFWNINSRPISTSTPSEMIVDSGPVPATDPGLRCEDCDDSIRTEDAMDVDGDLTIQETQCSTCRRTVCDRCAVLGDERVCLSCAVGKG